MLPLSLLYGLKFKCINAYCSFKGGLCCNVTTYWLGSVTFWSPCCSPTDCSQPRNSLTDEWADTARLTVSSENNQLLALATYLAYTLRRVASIFSSNSKEQIRKLSKNVGVKNLKHWRLSFLNYFTWNWISQWFVKVCVHAWSKMSLSK